MSGYNHIVDLIMEDDLEEAELSLLTESEEANVIRQLGDPTMLNYLLKFEQYMDDHDVYLFKGWDDAVILRKPQIEKFWCVFYLGVDADTDLRGALRLSNDKEGQNKIQKKETSNGIAVKFRILKRYLDQLEVDDQERASELANEELENI